ncbi:TonB-dependent receptor [Aestuariibacter halophilus]|uniref:TonB-dependent receptor n=1 Tax=Fluctibacter halophilus TaxID=226011 RepID=A0ABS8GAM4_9ALTE|nr:TonB-dependent receptor [Aestuariibacter halophilus]MCC2617136.1 TonB-dependent receptor [Aestuariibacter halophilus]
MSVLFLRRQGVLCRALFCLSAVSASVAAQTIETIQVHGQSTPMTKVPLAPSSALSADYRDALSTLPGVTVNSNGPLTALPQYRGLFGYRLPVDVDHAPVIGAGPNAMDPPLSHALPLPAQQITFYAGVAPVSAGAETLAGKLSVSQNTEALFSDARRLQGNLTLQATNQGNERNHSGHVLLSDDNYYAAMTAMEQRADARFDGNNNAIPNGFYQRRAMNLQGGWRDAQQTLQWQYNNLNTDASGTPALAMDIEYIDAQWYRASVERQLSGNHSLSVRWFGNTNQHGMNNYQFRPTPNNKARLNTVDSRALGGSVALLSRLSDSSTMQWGVETLAARHNSVITNPLMGTLQIDNFNDIQRDRYSLFGQWEFNADSWQLQVGTRATRVEAQADDVSHSMAMMMPAVAGLVERFNTANKEQSFQFVDATLNLVWDWSDGWQGTLDAGVKHRAPEYSTLYTWLPLGISGGLADGQNYLGNLDLNEEQNRQLNLGIAHARQDLQFTAQLFYQDIADYILGEPSQDTLANQVAMMMGNSVPLQWQNIDAHLWGLEAGLVWQWTSQWSFEANGALTRGKRDDRDEPLYRIAPANFRVAVQWQQGGWSAGAQAQWIAAQTDVSSLQLETPSEAYSLVDLHGQYRWSNGLLLRLSVSNLFDTAYQSHLAGINRVADASVPVGERLYGRGRTVHGTLSWQW